MMVRNKNIGRRKAGKAEKIGKDGSPQRVHEAVNAIRSLSGLAVVEPASLPEGAGKVSKGSLVSAALSGSDDASKLDEDSVLGVRTSSYIPKKVEDGKSISKVADKTSVMAETSAMAKVGDEKTTSSGSFNSLDSSSVKDSDAMDLNNMIPFSNSSSLESSVSGDKKTVQDGALVSSGSSVSGGNQIQEKTSEIGAGKAVGSSSKKFFSRLGLKFLTVFLLCAFCIGFFTYLFTLYFDNDFVAAAKVHEELFWNECAYLPDMNGLLCKNESLDSLSKGLAQETKGVAHQNLSDVLIFVALMILFIFLVLYAAYKVLIWNPLSKIRASFARVERGDLDYRIRLRSKDEMSDLAASYNRMLIQLKQSKSALEYRDNELKSDLTLKSQQLNAKVKELEETRTAILNILEDVNQSKDDLEVSQEQLLTLNEDLKYANEELMKVDSYKNQFISVTAHELKTPLASIHGFASLLQNKKVADNVAQRTSYLKIIIEEADRLKKLIDDILDLSRLDLGTMKFVFEEVDPADVLQVVFSELNFLAKKRDQVLRLDVKKKLPKLVTDKTRLMQVIVNLVNNSIKYSTKKGGQIIISAAPSAEGITFSVKDEGIGIPKKSYPHIFQRFYQVDASFTRKVGGTGLGLSICKGLVQAMGGFISFSSVLGKGSTFTFSLPLKYAEASSEEKSLKVLDTSKMKASKRVPVGKKSTKPVLKSASKPKSI